MIPLVELALSDRRKRLKSILDTSPADLTELHTELSNFLLDEENIRIILYLPFNLLPSPGTTFADIYLKSWKKLLTANENDLRTNFVDGDVLEPELGENPRVRKAAHLIPKLVDKGLLSPSDVVSLFTDSKGDKILHDSIADTLPILACLGLVRSDLVKAQTKPAKPTCPPNLKARIAWEDQERKNKKIIEFTDRSFAYAKYFLELFTLIWGKSNLETREDLATILFHWLSMGVIKESDLKVFNLKRPDLESTQNDDITKEVDDLNEKIKSNEELFRILYPVGIAFGSRVKGYAKLTADLDIAVFVRPGVPWTEKSKIYKTLGKVTEFWLEEKDNDLVVRSMPLEENNVAEKDWIHIPLQGIWLGEPSQIRYLQQKFLPRYLNSTNRTERTTWLRQLELEALQYRLMHKGYARFYPVNTADTATAKYSYLIDSDSVFWDSGYRLLATKLFISRVFLPKMKDLEK